MLENMLDNNTVKLIGEIDGEFRFDHEVFGEKFYRTTIRVDRLSSQVDRLPLTVSDRLMDVSRDYSGQTVEVDGQFRSFNLKEVGHSRLLLSVFAKDIFLLDDGAEEHVNAIELDGFLCKEPVYRKTPLGREIADLLVAVNRSYGKSDYIPCIAWGRNARYIRSMSVGMRVHLEGRIQSREYEKKIDNKMETRTAYEVSVNRVECIN